MRPTHRQRLGDRIDGAACAPWLLVALLGCSTGQTRPDASDPAPDAVAGDTATAGTGGAATGGQAPGSGGAVGSGGAGGTGGVSGTGGATGGTSGATGGATTPTGGTASGGSAGAPASGGAAGHANIAGSPGTGAGGSAGALGGPVKTTTQHLDIGVHDPSMIWDGQRYVLFATGGKLSVRTSPDLQKWTDAGRIFASTPAWITSALGADPGDLWAPDVSFFDGLYHVYYAGSTFGSNLSVIGLATTPTLDRSAANYLWADQGLIVQSKKSDNFNAIDPNVAFDDAGTPWLSFGSFWTGIKLRKLDRATGKLASDDTTVYALAARGSGGAIEAPSIISRNGFYYLFVSFDACCKGVDSTYRTMVGRASKITGPYVDKAGKSMAQGAAEQLLASNGRYIGPGGGTAFRNGSVYLYAFHYYDGQGNGASKLQVRPISFSTDDWPTLDAPLFP
jgi:arabinan endo-1,5-alpha-L-arabinosidase